MPTLTADMLSGACVDQVAEFERRFPYGVTVETRGEAIAAANAVAGVFVWDWAADNLLSTPAREVYEAATARAWEARDALNTSAWEAYEAATASAWDAYETAEAGAWESYEIAMTPAREAYKAAMTPAREAYKATMAGAWEAYKVAKASAFAAAWFDDHKLDANCQTEGV